MKKINLMHFSMLSEYSEVQHFVTSRQGGVGEGNYATLNLSIYTGDDFASVINNRGLLCDTLGITPDRLVLPFQTHGDRIAVVDSSFLVLTQEQRALRLHGVDAIITSLPQFCIGVTTADCVPVLLYDPVHRVVAAIHAGWRSTVARICAKTVLEMIDQFGTDPSGLIVGIGPSISPEVYEVGEEVAQEFRINGFSDFVLDQYKKPHIDLWKANRQDLIDVGVKSVNIETSGICTYTQHEKFFSARRLGVKSGRFVTGIMIK